MSLHGFLLAVGWPARHAVELGPSLVTLVVAFVPWVFWAGREARSLSPSGRAALEYGVIPGAWLAALAVLEALGNPMDVSTVVVAAAGIAAHVGAALHLDRQAAPRPGLSVDRSGREGLPTTRRRATLRYMLLGAVGLSFGGLFAWASEPNGDTTPLEHTFAVVIVGMLGTSVVLLVMPRAMRRVKTPPDEARAWPKTVLLACATIALTLGLEYWTR